MNLSVTIQSHPYRQEMAEALAARIGCGVTWDPQPDGRPNAWRTYRHALETAPAAAERLLIVQDDIEPCLHLAEAAAIASAATPDDGLLCFFVPGATYLHTRWIDAACMADKTITPLPHETWVPVVATAWPTAEIERILAWIDEQNYPEGFTSDDEIAGRVTRALLIPVYATVPSLVEHPDDVVSIVGSGRTPMYGRDKNRIAHCYIGDDVDPLDIAWSL